MSTQETRFVSPNARQTAGSFFQMSLDEFRETYRLANFIQGELLFLSGETAIRNFRCSAYRFGLLSPAAHLQRKKRNHPLPSGFKWSPEFFQDSPVMALSLEFALFFGRMSCSVPACLQQKYSETVSFEMNAAQTQRQNWWFPLAVLAVLLFGIFVWPTQYQIEKTKIGTRDVVIQVNRLSGKVKVLVPAPSDP